MAELRMPQVNYVEFAGNLTRDPDQHNPNGPVKFGIAVNTGFGEKQKTMFLNVIAWQKTGEWCKDHLKKGYPVLISGHMEQDNWTDNEGNERSTYNVNAYRVQCLRWENNANNKEAHAGGEYEQAKTSTQTEIIDEPIPEDDVPF